MQLSMQNSIMIKEADMDNRGIGIVEIMIISAAAAVITTLIMRMLI